MSDTSSQGGGKIIDAFTRKEFVAPKRGKKSAKPPIDKMSLHILNTAMEHVKTGVLSHVSLIGIAHQAPVVLRTFRESTIAELAIEGLSADILKEFVMGQVDERIAPTVEGRDGEDLDPVS